MSDDALRVPRGRARMAWAGATVALGVIGPAVLVRGLGLGNYRTIGPTDGLAIDIPLAAAFVGGVWLVPAAYSAFAAPAAAGESGSPPWGIRPGVVIGRVIGVGLLAVVASRLIGGMAASALQIKIPLAPLFAIDLAGLALGAWIGWGKARPPSSPRAGRRLVALTPPLLLLAAAGYAGWTSHDFPGGSAAADVRSAWARETLGRPYDDVVDMLRRSPAVASALGPLEAVAPVPGPNWMAIDDHRLGAFTLGLRGTRGQGVAHVTVRYRVVGAGANAKWRPEFAGRLEAGGEARPLP